MIYLQLKKIYLRSRIFSLLFFISAIFGALIVFDLNSERSNIFNSASHSALQKVQIMGQTLEATFLAADYVLRDILDHVQSDHLVFPDPDPAHHEKLIRLFNEKRLTVPDASTGGIYNGDCIYVVGVGIQPGFRSKQNFCTGASVLDRAKSYMQYFLADPINKLSANIAVSRNRWSVDGKLEGGALIAIDTSRVQSWIDSIKNEPHDVLAVFNDDGDLIASTPRLSFSSEKRRYFQSILKLPATTSGYVFRGTTLFDGRLRIYGVRKLENFPLNVLVGYEEDDLLLSWRWHSLQLGGGFFALLAITFIAVRAYHNMRHQRGQLRESKQTLELTHQRMTASHKKIDESIEYASLIQRAILPDLNLSRSLGMEHSILWRPRDVIGGDFYVFRAEDDKCLLGVFDCAGHGVPGAMMTMLLRAVFDHAINKAGICKPSVILEQLDKAIRTQHPATGSSKVPATNADAGLVFIDKAAGILRFSGAQISLYICDGNAVSEVRGSRRALGHRRRGDFTDVELRLESKHTYTLVTDGFLDQAGGMHGFGFGRELFMKMLLDHFHLPIDQQSDAFAAVLAQYQADQIQRDDITVVTFGFA